MCGRCFCHAARAPIVMWEAGFLGFETLCPPISLSLSLSLFPHKSPYIYDAPNLTVVLGQSCEASQPAAPAAQMASRPQRAFKRPLSDLERPEQESADQYTPNQLIKSQQRWEPAEKSATNCRVDSPAANGCRRLQGQAPTLYLSVFACVCMVPPSTCP